MRERANETDFAELAIAVYVEELAVDKRVLYVGDVSSQGPERLAGVARSIDLVSRHARARGTRRGGRLQTRRWPGKEDDGKWDLVLVPDLSQAGLTENDQLAQARRWLAKGGILVAGTDSGGKDAVGYERFFDLLQESFDSVRMVGQAPFAGYSVVDFAPAGELEVTFDGSLLSGAGVSAERYLALCADRDVVLDPYAVVQVPGQAAAPAPASGPDPEAEERLAALTDRVRAQQDSLDAANVHAEEIERELEVAREDLGKARRRLDTIKDVERNAEEAKRRLQRRIEDLERQGKQAKSAPGGGATDQEYARLETALRECGRELTTARAELARRQVLVRDLVEELREAQRSAPVPAGSFRATVPAPATSATDPVARAVAAEAEKAELGFRLDEVRGELAMAERRHASEHEELRRMEAALRGTVRGLNARLAEVTELYQQHQARAALLEDDARAAENREQELTRQLALVRERLEFEIARAHSRAHGEGNADTVQMQAISPVATTEPPGISKAQAEDMAEREGALMGQLARAREKASDLALEVRQAQSESELAKQAVTEHEERIAGMVRGYQARMAEINAELDRAGSEAERALIAEGEMQARLEALRSSESAARGEADGLRLRLTDREAAVADLTAAAAVADEEPTDPGELARLREEIAHLRADLREDHADEPDPEPEPEPEAAPEAAEEPQPTVAASEAQVALVARLQSQLARAVEARRTLERELDDKNATLDEQVEAVESAKVEADVHVGQTHRELDELMDRLEESETERRRALAALEDSKAILAKLMQDLPEAGADATNGGAELRGLRERVEQLDAEAADRELLLRSLTAQLQERDDRLRALDRLAEDDGGEEDPGALRARLFEMEERVARLSEELEHERDARRRLEQP